MSHWRRIFWLGIKEFRSLANDRVMLGLLIYAFTIGLVMEATGTSTTVNNASIAFADEDRSNLSRQLAAAFLPPEFQPVVVIEPQDAIEAMDHGEYLFVVMVPPHFEADLRSRANPEIQVLIDATAMEQAGIGASYIANILTRETVNFALHHDVVEAPPIELIIHSAFNPNRDTVQYQSLISIINAITTLTIVLTGAAVVREREHGTIEHLLAMPLTPFDIAVAKIWSNGSVVLLAASLSMQFVVEGFLNVQVAGSSLLFVFGALIYLFSATSLGIFLAIIARSMAQFALLFILSIMPLQLLSGGDTPVANQPDWLQSLTIVLPTRHFVSFSQAVIFRGAGFTAVWFEIVLMILLGLILLFASIALFRRSTAANH